MQGQLGEKLVPDLVRAVAHKGMSGLLRLTRGKTIKAIFFEAGAPKFAISNLATEQLDQRLIRENMATLVQIEAALQRAGKAPRLAAALVEMGTLSESEMRRMVRGQVMDIIVSVFEWVQGDYAFDERIRAAHDFTLDITAADVILEGARQAAKNEQLAQHIAPSDGVLVRASSTSTRIDSGKLLPVESYVLSRIESPTAVSEVGALIGIADDDAHRAVVGRELLERRVDLAHEDVGVAGNADQLRDLEVRDRLDEHQQRGREDRRARHAQGDAEERPHR